MRYLFVFLLLVSVSYAQNLPLQPDLDLPTSPQNYGPNAQGVPVRPDNGDDPRDEPAPIFFGEEIDSENDTLIYVVDLSGSMGGKTGGSRLNKAKRETARSIAGLPPSIKFNIVTYQCFMTRLWPQLMPADGANKATALAWVESWGAGGGTATGPATAFALSDREVQSIALLTDGAPNCGAQRAEGHRRMIANANLQRATINVFGIDAAGDYRAFCMSVASDSGGSYFDVP